MRRPTLGIHWEAEVHSNTPVALRKVFRSPFIPCIHPAECALSTYGSHHLLDYGWVTKPIMFIIALDTLQAVAVLSLSAIPDSRGTQVSRTYHLLWDFHMPSLFIPFLFLCFQVTSPVCTHVCIYRAHSPNSPRRAGCDKDQWSASSPSCVPLQSEVSALFISSCRKFPHGDRSVLHIALWLWANSKH